MFVDKKKKKTVFPVSWNRSPNTIDPTSEEKNPARDTFCDVRSEHEPAKNQKWLRKIDVLFRKFQQHGIIEEFVDGHVFAESFTAASLHHEFPGQMGGGLRFQRSQHNALVERISRNDLPVVEHRQAKSLSLGVCPQIRLETKRVDCRNKRLSRENIRKHNISYNKFVTKD